MKISKNKIKLILFMFLLVSCHKENGLYIRMKNSTEIEVKGQIYLSEDNKTYNKADEWQFTVNKNGERTIFIKPTKSRYFGVISYNCNDDNIIFRQDSIIEFTNEYKEYSINIDDNCSVSNCIEEKLKDVRPDCKVLIDDGGVLTDDINEEDINSDVESDVNCINKVSKVGLVSGDLYFCGVFVSGNLAYLSAGSAGLKIYDISDMSNISEAGSFTKMGINTQKAYVSDGYIYVADGSLDFYILKANEQVQVEEIGYYQENNGTGKRLYVSGGYVYLADAINGLLILDTSDLTSPQKISQYNIKAIVNDVYVSGNYAFLAAGSEGLKVVDITDKSNPQEVGFYETNINAAGVYVSGDYAYLAVTTELKIIDISDKSSPQEISSYDIGVPLDISHYKQYIFIAQDSYGLRIIDISSPTSPDQVASYETYTGMNGVFVNDDYIFTTSLSQEFIVLSYECGN